MSARFPTTLWTVIREAGAGEESAAAELVGRYRPVVVRFARSRGLDEAAAEDVAQEVFLRLFDDRVLEGADRARGRFRSLVLAVTRHVLGHHFERRRAAKRGGGRAAVPLEGAVLEEALARDERDDDFDREWVAALLARSLRRLAEESPDQEACLRAFGLEEKSQRAIAETLGQTESAVRNKVLRARTRLAELLRAEIAVYSSSDAELEAEVRYLSRLLARKAP